MTLGARFRSLGTAVAAALTITAIAALPEARADAIDDAAIAACAGEMSGAGASNLRDWKVRKRARSRFVYGTADFGSAGGQQFRCRVFDGTVTDLRYLTPDAGASRGFSWQAAPPAAVRAGQAEARAAAAEAEASAGDENAGDAAAAEPAPEASAELPRPVFEAPPGDDGPSAFQRVPAEGESSFSQPPAEGGSLPGFKRVN